MSAILFSILALAAIGWVLHVNARDRAILEKELDQEFACDRGQEDLRW
jgi:hypothetical protein